MDRGQISRHYLRTWFLLDLVSCLPLSELLTSPSFGLMNFVKVGSG